MDRLKLLIVNGPNLNLTGEREAEIYGNISFDDYFDLLQKKFPELEMESYQSNVEGEIINRLQEADREVNGIILNAGGYTHTSVAIGDAVKAIGTPVVEVHISNILAREEFRHVSLIAPNSVGSIMGFGLDSYRIAVRYFLTR